MLPDLPISAKFALIGLTSIGLTVSPPPGPSHIFTVRMTGQAESNVAHAAGGTGDLRASGLANISIDPPNRQVCYELRLSGLSDPMMAHIHKGWRLQNGPPVIILFVGTRPKLKDCVASTDSQLREILANPQHYYISVDSTDFPDGALRGQL